MELVTFGGGCFWCTEAVFKMLKGVSAVMPGYAGGIKANPTYEDVGSGKTGHAEVIQITYNPKLVPFKTLLTIFFASHDPTTLNRQGNDVGTQYRSVVFYSTQTQKKETEAFINELNTPSTKGAKIVTEVAPLTSFYPAEEYHRNYYANNRQNSYCQVVINPKLEKVQKEFGELLNTPQSLR